MGFEVAAAGKGEVTIRMSWRDDLTQYSGHLHAGLIAALLDTACGFAAATLVGPVTASHFSMNCLRPAIGTYFVAKGTTLRAGRRQVFARAELFAADQRDDLALVATGETVLVPTGEPRKADGS
ncbi:thioesterase superfamily protein [Bradyrhizobium japonicum SEMIA 5079]|nr:thioesterase superfamily protein [Bradyrhizobium japonicum SEMIA 5079]